MKKPSDFKMHPYSSVKRNSESETVAKNIMIILSRTGDEWRKVSFEEYSEERKKDGNFSSGEKHYFDSVIDFTVSQKTAELFSPKWKKS